MPIAQTSREIAASASSGRVIPQNLILGTLMHLILEVR
jgi:hypothetical protein